MRSLTLATLLLATAGCRCGPTVNQVPPSLGAAPVGLDFGAVKLGQAKTLTVRLEARTRAEVVFSSIALEGAGAAAYRLGTTPASLEPNGSATFSVTFTPTAVAGYTAAVAIASNDPDRPVTRVALVGEGALPKLELTPECAAARGCVGTAVVTPPSIDFGAEPFMRLSMIDPTRLPSVTVVNAGSVDLEVSSARFEGNDAAAFSFAGNAMFPAGGLTLGPAEGRNFAIRFSPTSEAQATYAAELVVESDDPDEAVVRVALTGTLRPNQPPVVCANLVRVVPQIAGDAPRDYATAAEWASLIPPPSSGYDFRSTRDVRPDELVQFSALSDLADPSRCTTDPEDGRMGLAFSWQLVSAPAGAENLALAGAATPQLQLRPLVTGEYTLRLSVRDARMAETSVTLTFAVALKQDFVAQLRWPGAAGVDLDLHLVRPSAMTPGDPFSGVFSPFTGGASGKTSGDLNGYARRQRDANVLAGFDFDWGLPGASDDPRLNVDDRGDGQLLENVSLNFPENDPLCATTACTYGVYVHVFNDARAHMSPPACIVDGGVGCQDGEACSCAGEQRCVAESAPVGVVPTGAGKCYPAAKPTVQLFFRGSPTPAHVIPLEGLTPPDAVLLAAPCTMWHVADVAWPPRSAIGSLPDGGTPPPVVTVIGADGTGRLSMPRLARFGYRQSGGSLQCSPDGTAGTLDWYSRQP
jgi:hypothetical protein